MEHRIITKNVISKEGWAYKYNEEVFGSGQDTGWSPNTLGGSADVIAVAIELYLDSMKFLSPTRKIVSERTSNAYVDNITNGIIGNEEEGRESVGKKRNTYQ